MSGPFHRRHSNTKYEGGKWDPHSTIINRRLHNTAQVHAEDSGDSDDWNGVGDVGDLSDLAYAQTKRDVPDEEEIANARRGFKEAIQNGNDSLFRFLQIVVEVSVITNEDGEFIQNYM